MKFTNEVLKGIPALYEQENVEDPIVHLVVKVGRAKWLITEVSDGLGFGWCDLGDPEMAELGYVSIDELEEIAKSYPMYIGKTNKLLSVLKKELS